MLTHQDACRPGVIEVDVREQEVPEVAELDRVRNWLDEVGPLARDESPDEVARMVEERMRSASDEEAGDRLVQAAPPDQMHLGLARYWRKKAEREAA